jgi:hypothetical protein
MRPAFAALILFSAAALLHGQPPKEPPKEAPKEPPKVAPKEDPDYVSAPKEVQPRYSVKPRLKAYPQSSPKETLRSAVAAIDRADYLYLAAHLLDPKFVDTAVAERAGPLEREVAAELLRARDAQRPNLNAIAPEERIPYDPTAFAALVTARARERMFRQLTKELEQKLAEDPQAMKEMRRILRAPNPFAEADPVATATLPEIKGRALYFKKIGDRWFLENRNTDEPKKEP